MKKSYVSGYFVPRPNICLRGLHHNFSGTVNLCEAMLNLDLCSVEIFYKGLIMNCVN